MCQDDKTFTVIFALVQVQADSLFLRAVDSNKGTYGESKILGESSHFLNFTH